MNNGGYGLGSVDGLWQSLPQLLCSDDSFQNLHPKGVTAQPPLMNVSEGLPHQLHLQLPPPKSLPGIWGRLMSDPGLD